MKVTIRISYFVFLLDDNNDNFFRNASFFGKSNIKSDGKNFSSAILKSEGSVIAAPELRRSW